MSLDQDPEYVALRDRIGLFKAQIRSGTPVSGPLLEFKKQVLKLLTTKNISLLSQLIFDLLQDKNAVIAFEVVCLAENFQITKNLPDIELYALTARTADRPDIALSLLERYLDEGGQIEQIMLELSYCFLETGDKESAKELLMIYGRTTSLGASLIGLADIAKVDGHLEEAIAYYEKALSTDMKEISQEWVCEQIGRLYSDLGIQSKSYEWIEKSLELKESKGALLAKALNLLRMNELQEAEKCCLRALEMSPGMDARRTLFQVLRRVSLDQAASCLADSFRICGDVRPVELMKDQANLLFDRKDWLGALEALEDACRGVALSALKRTNFGLNRKLIPAMNKGKAEATLFDFAILCKQNDVPFFLAFGSALGAVREGKLLGFDKDIDIGILPNGDLNEVIRLVEQSPLFSIDKQFDDMFESSLDDARLFAAVRHLETGICIDLSQFFEYNGKYYAGFHKSLDTEFLWEFEPFDIRDVECAGGTFPVPCDSDLFLSSLYGDWRTPNETFDTIVMGGNLTAKSEIIRRCYGLFRFYENYVGGDWAKCLSLATNLAKQEAYELWLDPFLRHLAGHIDSDIR